MTVESLTNPQLIKKAADLARSRSATPLDNSGIDRNNLDHRRIEEIFHLLMMAASTTEAKESLRDFQHDRAVVWGLEWLEPKDYVVKEKMERRSNLLTRFLGARRASKGPTA
jgi:hypothetical protein